MAGAPPLSLSKDKSSLINSRMLGMAKRTDSRIERRSQKSSIKEKEKPRSSKKGSEKEKGSEKSGLGRQLEEEKSEKDLLRDLER